ncbi:MAG: NAD(P)H-dependent oxidoreductase [Candidatus Melainabacteria bacterium]|jgi:FMN reductase|nr:NAD(P)H-dependent oxidoreductase [Candidatus Melainabacteria bacterium]
MTYDYLVISTSLNADSKSRIMAKELFDELAKREKVKFIDLKDYPLPVCDGNSCYTDSNVKELTELISNARCVLMAAPVYNFYLSAAAKNLIELTGRAWTDKLVGFLCAAGGKSSYMSVMNVANSLMLDFRCLIIPRFVYADGASFQADRITDSDLQRRIVELADTARRLIVATGSMAVS